MFTFVQQGHSLAQTASSNISKLCNPLGSIGMKVMMQVCITGLETVTEAAAVKVSCLATSNHKNGVIVNWPADV